MATIIVIQIVLFSAAMAQQQFGDSNLDGLWFHITSAGNPFLPSSQSPCLLRGSPAVKRDDYTFTPGIGAHKVHTRAASWNEAWQTCRNEGARLAIINSYAEAKLLVELLKKAGPMQGGNEPVHAHIGYHDLHVDREWVTVDGQSLMEAGFAEWNVNEPSGLSGTSSDEHCGSMHENGKLNDQHCTIKICRFICELPYAEPEALLAGLRAK